MVSGDITLSYLILSTIHNYSGMELTLSLKDEWKYRQIYKIQNHVYNKCFVYLYIATINMFPYNK